MNLDNTEFENILPSISSDRPNCAFFGFRRSGNSFYDDHDNGCSLLDKACANEPGGPPCWSSCKLRIKKDEGTLDLIKSRSSIKPNELGPTGIGFSTWFKAMEERAKRALQQIS